MNDINERLKTNSSCCYKNYPSKIDYAIIRLSYHYVNINSDITFIHRLDLLIHNEILKPYVHLLNLCRHC